MSVNWCHKGAVVTMLKVKLFSRFHSYSLNLQQPLHGLFFPIFLPQQIQIAVMPA